MTKQKQAKGELAHPETSSHVADKAGDLWWPKAERHPLENAGAFTGGGHKIVLHTTEGPTLAGAVSVLAAVRAAPHFAIDPRTGETVQMIPLNLAGRALEHPAGTPETNRANAIQIEMIGYAKDTPNWTDEAYAHVRKLCQFIERSFAVPSKCGVQFAATPHRLAAAAYTSYAGYLGHEHVPNQPSGHWDPGAFKVGKILDHG